MTVADGSSAEGDVPPEPVLPVVPAPRSGGRDGLTGGPDRREVEAGLASLIVDGTPFAVLLVGLSGLAAANARVGRAGGDALLATAHARARRAAGPGALVGRLVGTEIVVVVRDAPGRLGWLAHTLTDDLIATLREPATHGGVALSLQPVVVTALHPEDADGVDELLAVATARLLAARRRERSPLLRLAARLASRAG